MITNRFHHGTRRPQIRSALSPRLILASALVLAGMMSSLAAEPTAVSGDTTTVQLPAQGDSALYEMFSRLQARQQKVEQELGRLNEVNRTLGLENQSLAADLDAARKEVDDLRGQLESQEQSHAKSMSEAAETRAALEKEREELRSVLETSIKKRTELEGLLKKQADEHAAAAAAARETETKLKAKQADLEAELGGLREEMQDLKQQHTVLQETHAGAVAAMERLQKDKAELMTALEAGKGRAAELTASLDEEKKKAADLKLEAEAAASKAAAERERLVTEMRSVSDELEEVRDAGAEQRRALEERLEARESEIRELKTGLADLKAALGQTESELVVVKEQLPAAAGGSVTEEEIRQQGAKQMQALRDLHHRRPEMSKEEWEEARERLEGSIRDEQFMLAQSLSARSVYRVQRDDTLARISLTVYGTANRWPEIFEANRHLLENPDRVFPGMSLVIP